MLNLSMICLTISLLISCASQEKTAFDGKWEFHQVTPFEPVMACLHQEDVMKLKELLNQCKKLDGQSR